MEPVPSPIHARFWSKVDFRAGQYGCWEWQGERNRGGYGRAWVDKRHVVAHRVAFQSARGPVPEGMQLDHLCRNRACVNPFHLEPVTARENTLRGEGPGGRHARQTHCKRGHPFDMFSGNRRGCRTCVNASQRRYDTKRRALERSARQSPSQIAAP